MVRRGPQYGREVLSEAQLQAQQKEAGSNPALPSRRSVAVSAKMGFSYKFSQADSRKDGPAGLVTPPFIPFSGGAEMTGKKLLPRHKKILRNRQMDPNNYLLLRDDWDKLILLDVRYDRIKIVHKRY